MSRRLNVPVEKWWKKKEEKVEERIKSKSRAGGISGIAILLLAPLLIARPLKIMNVNYA